MANCGDSRAVLISGKGAVAMCGSSAFMRFLAVFSFPDVFSNFFGGNR